MVKLKSSLKNLELDISVAKNEQCRIFPPQIPRQTANSVVRHETPRAAEYCWPCD